MVGVNHNRNSVSLRQRMDVLRTAYGTEYRTLFAVEPFSGIEGSPAVAELYYDRRVCIFGSLHRGVHRVATHHVDRGNRELVRFGYLENLLNIVTGNYTRLNQIQNLSPIHGRFLS